MPSYALRSAQRFRPAQGMSCHDAAPSALELRFVERSLGKHSGETDMSMIDVQKALLLIDAKKYAESMAEASFFERLLVKRSKNQLEDDADFGIAAYTHDFTAYTVADEQLEQLQDVAHERDLSLPSDDPTPEVRLNACLETILADMNRPMSPQLAV
ncbi:hypothetical protein BDR06DRAFT_1060507 [Suillus hirtellus]|nr:hypothetical protein BDR06DRAFT_1060507 [Suillus hirtellus]